MFGASFFCLFGQFCVWSHWSLLNIWCRPATTETMEEVGFKDEADNPFQLQAAPETAMWQRVRECLNFHCVKLSTVKALCFSSDSNQIQSGAAALQVKKKHQKKPAKQICQDEDQNPPGLIIGEVAIWAFRDVHLFLKGYRPLLGIKEICERSKCFHHHNVHFLLFWYMPLIIGRHSE